MCGWTTFNSRVAANSTEPTRLRRHRQDAKTPRGRAESAERIRSPLAWVPTSYLAEGIPFAMVIWVAGTMFKDLGHTDGEITVGTASVGIMWSLKPFWAPLLDSHRTKKFWVLAAEMAVAVLLLLAAMALRLQSYFTVILLLLWVLAFASATQDICVDGVYITSLSKDRQAAWIGVQGMCWNVGRIFATALVVWLAGRLKSTGSDVKSAWAISLCVGAGVMLLITGYHALVLPTGTAAPVPRTGEAKPEDVLG